MGLRRQGTTPQARNSRNSEHLRPRSTISRARLCDARHAPGTLDRPCHRTIRRPTRGTAVLASSYRCRPGPGLSAMLSRSITPLHATALVVGIIIGASIFVQPSVITGAVPTVEGVYSVWIVSGILTLFGALIAAELASAYPHAGGVYVFLREAFSPAVAFLWGWAMFWTMHTGIIAVIAMVFARYVSFFVPVGPLGLQLIAIGAIVLLSG